MGWEEVLVAGMKSWGMGGDAGGMDEELEDVPVEWMKVLGAGGGAGGLDKKLWVVRRCWWRG